MLNTVTINDENWAWLQSLARPLEDDLDDVLARLRQDVENPDPVATLIESSTDHKRLKRGLRTKVEEFKLPILAALDSSGGGGRPRDLLPMVEEQVEHILNDYDRERLKSGSLRWHKAAHWARYELSNDELIDASDFGFWRITDKGRERLEEPPV